MRSSTRSLFATIRTEGAILPSELLERIAKGRDFKGLTPESYHVLAGQKLNEVIERSWKQVLVAWRGFKEARDKSGDLDNTGTSLTRERWLYPLFQELGFGRIPAERKAREIDGREYFISHYYGHVPIHLIGHKIHIDRRTPGVPGAAKTAPHSLVQEFLNRTEEHLWAIVSNGLRLRLLRDNKSLTRQAYVEFDLEAMMEGDAFADFRVLWLLCHQSRFEADKPTECWLEKWSKIALDQGVRALDKLRGGVEEAIRALGKGFLAHQGNKQLKAKLRDGHLDRQDYYRQLLRVVYRLLFLFVAEDRDLLLLPELQGEESKDEKKQRHLTRTRYQEHYSTHRLRSLSQSIRGTKHPDLWRGLQLIMRGLGKEGGIPLLALPALGSYLWSEEACAELTGSPFYNPQPFIPNGWESNTPDLPAPFHLWVRPNPTLTQDKNLQEYALVAGFDGYEHAEKYFGMELAKWADPILKKFQTTKHLNIDSFEELRYLLFYQQRAMRHWEIYDEDEVEVLRTIHRALCAAWDREWPAKRQTLVESHQLTPPADIGNADLLRAVRALAIIEVEGRRTVVNYAHLRSEELGSVYESLLELHPELNAEAGTFDLHSAAGNERKTTGSYYTPDSLVQCLLDSALEPVMDEKEALAKKVAQKIARGTVSRNEWSTEELDLIIPQGQDPEEALASRMVELLNLAPADRQCFLREAALIGMRVCDPACGSGHFLIAASHRIARRLARVRTGDEEPAPEALQHAMRDVVGRCLYGVDINPMALELAKVALWMEAIEPGKPLGFLDAHFQCGNALLGTTPELIANGLPDGAFKPITGDDKKFVSALKKRNKQERESGEQDFISASGTAIPHEVFEGLNHDAQALFAANSDSLSDVQNIAPNSSVFRRAKFVADLWCAAFVWPKVQEDEWQTRIEEAKEKGLPFSGPNDHPEPPTHDLIQRCSQHPEPWKLLSDEQNDMLARLVDQFNFIQWHILFADIFHIAVDDDKVEGGFDCMLGNPPWENVELSEKEFFASRIPDLVTNKTGSARKVAIESLAQTHPAILAEFESEKLRIDLERSFLRTSGLYPMCGKGRVNVSSVFAEKGRCSLANNGLLGFVLPSGIATDDTTKIFFQDMMTTHSLRCLYSFENEEFIFQGVHHATKFCLLVTGGREKSFTGITNFVFFARQVSAVRDPDRTFTLSLEDIKRLNPNTKTCPIFRNRRDAELSKQIYSRHQILLKEPEEDEMEQNPWQISFRQGLFNMTSDSEQFESFDSLEKKRFILKGNTFSLDLTSLLPLYEGKMFWHFDHRFGSYDGQSQAQANQGKLPELSDNEHSNPNLFSLPRYWVKEPEVRRRKDASCLQDWYIAFRAVTSSVVLRTAVFTIIPGVAVGHKAPLMISDECSILQSCLLACINSFCFDFTARQGVGGSSLSYFILKQLPVVVPNMFQQLSQWNFEVLLKEWVAKRVLELSYTAWDLESFAFDCNYKGPPFIWEKTRRFRIRAELDAAFFHLYLGTPDEWISTGSPELLESFPTPRDAVNYIMETFPIVKKKDIKAHGTYRTKEAILKIYDAMAEAICTDQPYQTVLDPPPGPPADAEGNFIPMAQWNPNNWPKHIHLPKETPVEVEVPAAVKEIPVPGMDFDFDDDQVIPVGGVETFVYAVLPRLLTLESPMSLGIARDAALLASDPVAMKLLLSMTDAVTVDSLLPNANAIDFTPDTRRVRFSEMTDGLIASAALSRSGTVYHRGEMIEQHLSEHPIPEFLNKLLPLAVKAARRMEELRVIYAREHQLTNQQEQKAFNRITAREEAAA
jgi:Eco57I restriction-modification methylase